LLPPVPSPPHQPPLRPPFLSPHAGPPASFLFPQPVFPLEFGREKTSPNRHPLPFLDVPTPSTSLSLFGGRRPVALSQEFPLAPQEHPRLLQLISVVFTPPPPLSQPAEQNAFSPPFSLQKAADNRTVAQLYCVATLFESRQPTTELTMSNRLIFPNFFCCLTTR